MIGVSVSGMGVTGGETVALALEALGVEHVFGIVSVHNLPIYDAIARRGVITPISVRHEQGAVHAADGYARATGRLGVCITSTGPGAANGMTGLFEASFASSRVLMITGQIESRYYGKGKGFLHEAEQQLPMLRTVTRRAETVRSPGAIAATVLRVADDICTGRPQPGAVEIPVDFQYAVVDGSTPITAPSPTRLHPDTGAIDEAVAALAAAERPVLWAGGGVISAGASSVLVELAERMRAPVFTSVEGRGAIPEDHELAMGATTASPAMAATMSEADVVLAVGTRFQASATRNWTMPIPGRLVHLDADPAVIGRNYPPAIAIVGDALLGLEAMVKAIDSSSTDTAFTARAMLAAAAARQQARALIGPDHEHIMDTIRELLPRSGVVVRDATVPAYLWGDRLLPILEPRTSLRPASAAIGPALPLAIGAALGSGQPTVVIQGDGGFMLNLSELATAAQYNVPVVVCVFNDRGYGVIRSIQSRTFEGRTTGTELTTPDFVAVAEAMGVRAEAVATAADFRGALERALVGGGPRLLDIDMRALAPMGGLGAPPRRPPEPAR